MAAYCKTQYNDMLPLLMIVSNTDRFKIIYVVKWTDYNFMLSEKAEQQYLMHLTEQQCLQCFDAVGWVAGRASGL